MPKPHLLPFAEPTTIRGRRRFLTGAAALPALWVAGVAATSGAGVFTPDLIAAFRVAGRIDDAGSVSGSGPAADYVGVLRQDWQAGLIRIVHAIPVESRVHGLVAHTSGGYYAVACRPGKWLLRVDASGRIAQRRELNDEPGGRTLDGHAVLSPDRRWLLTTEIYTLSLHDALPISSTAKGGCSLPTVAFCAALATANEILTGWSRRWSASTASVVSF